MACDKSLFPTCGCDGETHGNECDANAAGQDVADRGNCKAPVGQFSCGSHFCDLKTSYCEIQLSDVSSMPSTHACIALPSSCGGIGTCACLSNVPCGSSCATTSDGGLKVSCPAAELDSSARRDGARP